MKFSLRDKLWFVAVREYREDARCPLGDWALVSVDRWADEAGGEWNQVLSRPETGHHFALATWSLRGGIKVLAMTNEHGFVDWSLTAVTDESAHLDLVEELSKYIERLMWQDGFSFTTNVSESESVR